MYFKDREIDNIIVVDDYLSPVMQNPAVCAGGGYMTREDCIALAGQLQGKNKAEIAKSWGSVKKRYFCCLTVLC